jgi:hypothetical protein
MLERKEVTMSPMKAEHVHEPLPPHVSNTDYMHFQIPHHSCELGTFFSQESFVWQNHIIQLIKISKNSPKNKHCIRMECK